MNELPRFNPAAKNCYITIPMYWYHMSVTNTKSSGNSLESGIIHFIEIANCSIGYGPNTPESAMNITVNFTPK